MTCPALLIAITPNRCIAPAPWVPFFLTGAAVFQTGLDIGIRRIIYQRAADLDESDSSETIKFWWKVSCEEDTDYLEFHIDGTPQHAITGDQDWAEKEYTISSGIHTLKWCYSKDSSGSDGDDEAWVGSILVL